MHNQTKLNIFLVSFLFFNSAFADSATQTDWSGGLINRWCTQEWNNQFSTAIGIDVYGMPGQLSLEDLEGYLESSVFDTDSDIDWDSLNWTCNTPSGTSIALQVRSSNDFTNLGNWSDTLSEPYSLDNLLDNGDRYFQYRVLMNTTDPDITPILEDITISWSQRQYGYILGKVIYSDGSIYGPILGATVLATGTSFGVMTDENGEYLLKIEAGTYSIQSRMVGMIPQVLDGVIVTAEDTTFINFELEPGPYSGVRITID